MRCIYQSPHTFRVWGRSASVFRTGNSHSPGNSTRMTQVIDTYSWPLAHPGAFRFVVASVAGLRMEGAGSAWSGPAYSALLCTSPLACVRCLGPGHMSLYSSRRFEGDLSGRTVMSTGNVSQLCWSRWPASAPKSLASASSHQPSDQPHP